MQSLVFKLVKAGLSLGEAELYVFIRNNPGYCVADACRKLNQSKSSIYRAFKELKEKRLVYINHEDWRYTPRADSFSCVVEMLEQRQQQDRKLIDYFESLENNPKKNPHSKKQPNISH